jgi:hypothetical protein
MVFTAVSPKKQEIDSLSNKKIKPSEGTKPNEKFKGNSFWGVQLLLLLPPIAILLSLICDFISIYLLAAPFREDHHIPLPYGPDLAKVCAYTAIGLLCLGATIVNSYRVRKFDRATGRVLREYNDLLHAKMALAAKLRDLPNFPKNASINKDFHGITSIIVLDSTSPAHIELQINDNKSWDTITKKQAEIRGEHVGNIDFRPSTTSDPHIILVNAAVKEPDSDKEIQYVIRELFRVKRLVYSHLAT